jgi:hypothetical protein
MSVITLSASIIIEIIPAAIPVNSAGRIQLDILPAGTPAQKKSVEYKFKIKPQPININLSDPIIETANQFLEDILSVYIDEERELKTLLNYGEDRQSVVLGYRRGPIDINGIDSIQLKLLQPVPDDITTNTPIFLSREVAQTVIDKVRVRFTQPRDSTPYLRPKNLNVKVDLDTGKSLRNVTFNRLSLQSGSVGITDQFKNKTFEDEIFRQWYSYDFNSSELNIDFTNYENFVFYGSATMRLAAFKQKLEQLERLETLRNQILTSYTANTASAGFIYLQEKSEQYSLEKENIVRSFDRYEQYLYFTPSGSSSPYSASFDYVDDGTEYNPIGYWPKSGSVVYSVKSNVATEWYESQSLIAQRFDEFNENNLVNTIPTHVREDSNNDAYVTFVSMIGQLFDNIKIYIDQYKNIYSRNLNPNEELSKDLINEIAESTGFTLPTVESIYNLTDNILGTTNQTPRRDLAAETYKRLLHNLPFFVKAKGTKTALQAFLNAFGITPQLLSIRETGIPVTSSYAVFDEYTTGLDFDETVTSFVRLPISSSNRTPTTLQFNFTVAKNQDMTILTGDDKWALNVYRHPTISTLGRFEIVSGSTNTRLVTSSYYNIFGDELLNIALQTYNSTSSFYFRQVDGEDIIFSEVVSNSTIFPVLWQSTNYVFLGGAGARVGSRYDGTLDEVRLWNTSLSDEVLLNTAFDPGSNAGDTYSDAANYLLTQLSFNTVSSASLAASNMPNETPYKNVTVSPSLENLFCFNITEASFTRYSRKIKQFTPQAGTSATITNKIIVAPDPVFASTSNGLRLYRDKSIVPIEQKKLNRGRNKVIMAMSPTDIVNQNIIRNYGLENINAILGAPTTLYTTFEKSLSILKTHYQQYHYVDVNTNKFIRILSDLSSVLNQVVDYFIPSKATLLKGIIIEPNILEQVKVPSLKNIKVYGKNTRRTLDAANSLTGSSSDYGATFTVTDTIPQLPDTIGKYSTYRSQSRTDVLPELGGKYNTYSSGSELQVIADAEITSEYTYYTSSFNAVISNVAGKVAQYISDVDTRITEINAIVNTITSQSHGGIDLQVCRTSGTIPTITSGSVVDNDVTINLQQSTYNSYVVQHQTVEYDGPNQPSHLDMGLSNLNKITFNSTNAGSPGAEPYNRVYTRKLFKEEIETTRLGGNTSIYVPGLYEIPPTADFKDFGVYTYFNKREGIYYFDEIKKTPSYVAPLNATWDFNNQTFGNTITSWSYGAKYNKYDVVYQDLSTDDLRQFSAETSSNYKQGNKRYYVFKTPNSYGNTTSAEAFYSGSIPSYTPPGLDLRNWDLLRFKPIRIKVPKRVVFDTYTVSDPAKNNFKTTTISVDKIINIPDRYIDRFEIGNITGNSYITGEFSLQNIALLFALQSNASDLRVRLYRTNETRDADITRSQETQPQGAHGVLMDTTISTTNVVDIVNPIITLVAGETPPNTKIFFTIDNLSSVNKLGIVMQLYYFAIEIEPRVPLGYLRKHYRFFRDNSTGTKRRNYLGCKNTIDTTIDGLPPVQVFVGEGTDIGVTQASLNEEIITGGGGTLDVT